MPINFKSLSFFLFYCLCVVVVVVVVCHSRMFVYKLFYYILFAFIILSILISEGGDEWGGIKRMRFFIVCHRLEREREIT